MSRPLKEPTVLGRPAEDELRRLARWLPRLRDRRWARRVCASSGDGTPPLSPCTTAFSQL